MAEGIRRSPIEALPRRRRQALPSTTVDTYFDAPPPSTEETGASRVVKGLLDFTGAAVDASVRQEQTKIELDKVTQQQRALQGLDPTDDATKAGIRAHQIVRMRDQVLEANTEIAQRVRDNPEMDDEQYEIASREVYAGLFEQYQSDPQLAAALSNRVQESQVQTHQIRAAAQREHREWQNQETFRVSIEEYREAASSPEELASMIQEGGQLANEADALGIQQEAQRTMLLNMADMDASNGDGRILRALESQEWASRDPRIQRARERFQQWEAQENAEEIGTQWGEIQMDWESRRSSWDQTVAAIERVNERFPGSISANQVASLRQRAAATHQRDTEKAAAVQGFWNAIGSGQSVHLGTNPLIPDEHKEAIVDNFTDNIETLARQRQASGEMSSEEAETWLLERKIEFSRQQGIEIPGIKPVIESLASVDPNDWEGDGVPQHFLAGLQSISMMNESDINMYGATERERNMMRNYQMFLSQDHPDRDAWVRAYRSVANRESMNPQARNELIDSAREGVRDGLSRGFFETWGARLGVGGREAAPDGLVSWMQQRADTVALSMVGTGGVNSETIARAATQQVLNEVTRLDSGAWITRNTQHLLGDAAFQDSEGRTYQLREDDLSPAFELFFENNRDRMIEESFHGEDLEFSQVMFRTGSNGLLEVVDDTGEPLLDGLVNIRNITKEYIDTESQRRATEATRRAQRQHQLNQRAPAERFGPGAVRP